MDKKVIDASHQNEKLNSILQKKQHLEANIEDYEKRIDEKITALVADGIIPEKITEDSEKTQESPPPMPIIGQSEAEDIFSTIDLSDDAALDQAVLSSKPISYLPAQTSELKADPPTFLLASDDDTMIAADEDQGADMNQVIQEQLDPEVIEAAPLIPDETGSNQTLENQPAEQLSLNDSGDMTDLHTHKPPKEKKSSSELVTQPRLQDILFPAFLFMLGIIACSVYFIGFSQNFSFIDYSILFILLTCLIFTIALPYNASIFFMVLITIGYGLFIIFSTLTIKIPLAAYQFGWFLLMPLTLTGAALLVRRIREVYHFKKELETKLSSYDSMESSPGLTAEKAYYKDLKQAMERASKNETVLLLELMAIPHLSTLRSMNGSRLWDEILFKTLKIIKKHCYSSHLIYILEGNVFSIIMENTSTKNQALINQAIQSEFKALIASYDNIDDDSAIELKIIAVPYSREITSPFDYRALLFKHLDR
ncbi:diguanylate cyclase [Eubacteriaceae bacterium ES2]|nr:diguanylate cyclase [Eubacteriaceae bacterium ES2]